MLKMTYGDYFLAELIEAQDDHMHCLVAEVSDVANLVLPRHAGKMSGFLRQQNNTIYAYKSIKQSMLSPFKFILRRRIFKTFLLRCYVALLRHDIVVAFMAQIFDVKANENAHYKRNELEFMFLWWLWNLPRSPNNKWCVSGGRHGYRLHEHQWRCEHRPTEPVLWVRSLARSEEATSRRRTDSAKNTLTKPTSSR